MPRTLACRAQRVVGAIAAAILAPVIRVRKIPYVDGAMTEHDQKPQSLAAKIQNLSDVEPSSWPNYISLGVLFLCLLVFDTETREQRAILCILTLTAAFVLWFGRRLRAFAQEADFRNSAVVREANIPGGSVRVFDDASIELQTAAGTRWFRSFAELERSLRGSEGVKTPNKAMSEPVG
jgi:hypothetical protein